MAAARLTRFDPARLRLSQDFAASLGIRKVLLTVPVRKPAKEWWVQVHPDPAYRLDTVVLELKEDRETYLVDRDLWPELVTETTISRRTLFTGINRQGVLFIWPIRLPGPDGKIGRLESLGDGGRDDGPRAVGPSPGQHELGAYDVFEARGELPDPEWPPTPFQELLRVAFKGHFIDTVDHRSLRRLRGEV